MRTEVSDESLDVKAFCELYGITFRNTKFHDRIAAVLEDGGFLVFSVARSGYCWQAIIAKESQHLLVMFDNEDGVSEIGLGIRYCRVRQGERVKLREEFELPPPDNFPREALDSDAT